MVVTPKSAISWTYRRKSAVAAGLDLIQNGDDEGCLRFDPSDPKQARAAVEVIHAYRRRSVSPAQREAMARNLARHREEALRIGSDPSLEDPALAQEQPS